jgi:hypothetical protein
MSPPGGRRELTLAVVIGTAAAAFALFAASRTWQVEIETRPAPLPAVEVARSGVDLAPALPALALVALAATGGLVAARRRARTLVGVIMAASGLGIAVAAAVTLGSAGLAWPAMCVIAGGVIGVVAMRAIRRGRSWPVMGARYERPDRRIGSADRQGSADGRTGTSDTEMWDAIDQGIDPTNG